jgi:Animal haem peroxidase
MATPWYERLLARASRRLSQRRVWYRWPFLIALPTLIGERVRMRTDNLYDTETAPPELPRPEGIDPRGQRMADGSFNDLAKPWMGKAGVRFGRNVPIAHTYGETGAGLYEPSPRLVSNKLLARREFVPVPHLNVLVPAWLQFMVHDWLSHGPNDKHAPKMVVPLPPGDDWPGEKMTVLPTTPDVPLPSDAGRPTTFTNVETHWWDGSQIYGSSATRLAQIRTDPATGEFCVNGKLPLGEGHRLPVEIDAKGNEIELAGVNGNWWVGLSVMHTLFAREHNAIVDRLRIDFPGADGDWLFEKARLVNAALMAKIHTVEWTPALMNSPEGRMAMRSNWWGLAGEHYARAYGRGGDSEILFGIPGSPAEHHGAPYSMTEEFSAAYRMHPLMPDEFSLRRSTDDHEVLHRDLGGVAGSETHKLYDHLTFSDLLYSLATSHPGALVLHNFPNLLRLIPENKERTVFTDLATVDVLRDRERGVPRYCAFRRDLGMFVPKSFAELTDDAVWQREIEEVYGEVEKVDLLVGMLAESKNARNGTPPGFGFSDTAFRIFILMASRRLKSDRFFTDDFRPEIYTPAGFRWVRDNNLRSVLERHCPELRPHFGDVRNVFFPWAKGRA